MATKLPVSELVDLAVAVGATITVVGQVLEDGKVDLRDLGKATDVFAAIRKFTNVDFAQVLPQASDLDEAELATVAQAFKVAFKLPDASKETTVEKGIDVLLMVVGLGLSVYKATRGAA